MGRRAMMISYDLHGPIVNIRKEKLWTRIDPLGFRDNFRYDFELEIADHIETESITEVVAAGKVIKKGNTYNDYYGFGSSRREAIEEAEKFQNDLASANLDIVVKTTARTTAVFFDEKKEPFYSGAARCFHVSRMWHHEPDTPWTVETTHEVWRNGQPGKDAKTLETFITEMKAADEAGPRRKGALR